MKFLALILMLSSTAAYSALQMNPGLWKVDMVIKSGGKEMNPTAQLKKAMAEMPEAQRKQMMAMMTKMNSGIGENGAMKVCYSKAMLENPKNFGKNDTKKCDTTVVTQTSTKVVTNFKCEDGTSGDATWSVLTNTKYKGVVNMNSPKTGKSEINYKADFLSADCGNVKPVI